MTRQAQHLLLLLLGGTLLRIAVDGTFLRYVRPAHGPLLLGAGAVMVVLAVVALVRDHRSAPVTPHDHSGGYDHGAGHDHGAVERRVPWLLLAPVLVIALVSPPALGADAVSRVGRPSLALADAEVFAPLPADGVTELSVGEFVQRAVWDTSGSLDGREVSLIGFAVNRGDATDLARLTISCCAADAQARRVRLVGDVGDIPQDTWMRVRGSLQPGTAHAATDYAPAMTVSAVEIITAPSDPYEY